MRQGHGRLHTTQAGTQVQVQLINLQVRRLRKFIFFIPPPTAIPLSHIRARERATVVRVNH